MIKKARKKPVEIEYVQYTPENRDFIIEWTDCRHTAVDDDGCLYQTLNLFIKTLEGEMMAVPGSYIIKGVKGEFYPCDEAIFKMTYDIEEIADV